MGVQSGEILLVGGADMVVPRGHEKPPAAKHSVQKYHPKTQEFSNCADTPFPCFGAATAGDQEVVCAAGGMGCMSHIQFYDVDADVWRVAEGLLKTPRRYGAAAMIDKKLYVIGGHNENDVRQSAIEVFDVCENRCEPAEDDAATIPQLTQPRGEHAIVVKDNEIYVIGGYCINPRSSQPVRNAKCEVINIANHEISEIAPLLYGRSQLSAVLHENKIVATGGWRGGAFGKATAEVYSFETGAWSYLPDMTTYRAGHSLVASYDKIYAIGGCRKNSVEYYDFMTDCWSPHHDMAVPRYWSGAVNI